MVYVTKNYCSLPPTFQIEQISLIKTIIFENISLLEYKITKTIMNHIHIYNQGLKLFMISYFHSKQKVHYLWFAVRFPFSFVCFSLLLTGFHSIFFGKPFKGLHFIKYTYSCLSFHSLFSLANKQIILYHVIFNKQLIPNKFLKSKICFCQQEKNRVIINEGWKYSWH